MKTNSFSNILNRLFLSVKELSTYRIRLILDINKRVGNHSIKTTSNKFDLCKEEVSRLHILGRSGFGMKFLDVGARDGQLTYLLGVTTNMKFDQSFYETNLITFKEKYVYFGVDLEVAQLDADQPEVIVGDICKVDFMKDHKGQMGEFDVVYSNNVFEHLEDPFCAARNIWSLCRDGGLIVTVVPFSQRYHESPNDYFRYTNRGIEKLFEVAGGVQVIESGYDLMGRRNNWQGTGSFNDIVPRDKFGAWRETWFTVSVLQKMENSVTA